MASITLKKTYTSLYTFIKSKFFLLHIPILFFLSIGIINNSLKKDTSRTAGHSLITKLRNNEISMVEFQSELAQLSKTSSTHNKLHIPLIGLFFIKFLLYWSAIVSTILIGLSYFNNRPLIIPNITILAKSALLLFCYFFCIMLLIVPFGCTIKIFAAFMRTAPLLIFILLLTLFSLGLLIFLLCCFSSALPNMLENEDGIKSSIRKSYRISKKNAWFIFFYAVILIIGISLTLHIISLPFYLFLPSSIKMFFSSYIGALITTLNITIFVSFYKQLSSPEDTPENTFRNYGA